MRSYAAAVASAAIMVTSLAACSSGPLASAPPAQGKTSSTGSPEILAQREDTLWENITVGTDGDLYFTDYKNRQILRYSSKNRLTTFATLPAHPIGLVFDADGTLYVSAGWNSALETSSPDHATSVFRIRPGGSAELFTVLEGAQNLNGWTRLSPGRLLLADGRGGNIWHLNTRTGEFTKYASDPLLDTTNPNSPTPGANGLKINGGYLYVSNTARATIFRAKLNGLGEPGPFEVHAANARADDFEFSPQGVLFYTTHQSSVFMIQDGKSVEFSRDPKVRGSTALTWGANGEGPYVLSDGGTFAFRRYKGAPAGPATLTRF